MSRKSILSFIVMLRFFGSNGQCFMSWYKENFITISLWNIIVVQSINLGLNYHGESKLYWIGDRSSSSLKQKKIVLLYFETGHYHSYERIEHFSLTTHIGSFEENLILSNPNPCSCHQHIVLGVKLFQSWDSQEIINDPKFFVESVWAAVDYFHKPSTHL